MLTVWILLMELSENTNAVGSRIRRRHHNSLMALWGASPDSIFL